MLYPRDSIELLLVSFAPHVGVKSSELTIAFVAAVRTDPPQKWSPAAHNLHTFEIKVITSDNNLRSAT